jgi:hypothetical protein
MKDIDTGFGIKEEDLTIDPSAFEQTGYAFKNGSDLTSKLFGVNGYSQLDKALSSTLYGLDIFNLPTPAQQTHEQFGLLFFTRPMLNLSYHNVTMDRTLVPLATQETSSVGRYIRALLDPIGENGKGWDCPLVDKENIFMPILSNTVETLSGWQDPILNTWTSAAGVRQESYTMADSGHDVFSPVDLSSTFRNVRGNILGYLFHVWTRYISLEYAGRCDPHPLFFQHNAIDYQTRVYHLILNQTRTHVENIACTGASFPLVDPVGASSNFNRSEVINTEVDTMSQTWRSMGNFYYDSGYMYDFNKSSGLLRPNFNTTKRDEEYRILWPGEYKLFTYTAFPRINPRTARLEWWVSRKRYIEVMGSESYAGMTTDN